MSTLLIEPFGGMAGDMLLAALLDLDDPRFTLADLEHMAASLVPGEARLVCSETRRGAMRGRLLDVQTPETGTTPHRHFTDLERLVAGSALSAAGRQRATEVLWHIAVAEAKVHGTTPEKVHFHEVSAVDTLIDVCGAVYALERLGVDRVLATPPLTGSGTVVCAHGEMPVPVPAVTELMRGRPMRHGGGMERLTPTGAAILAVHVESFDPPLEFAADAVGYGAGHREPNEGPPNLMRVQLGSAPKKDAAGRTRVLLLEVNLDDMSPEEIGHAVQKLREAGALEAWTSPVSMKKDRPGALVSALAREGSRGALERVVFEWTTTFGMRWTTVERTECGRRTLEVEVEGQPVRVKVRTRPDYAESSPLGERDLAPEHDDLVQAAEALGVPLRVARTRAIAAALEALRRA